MLTRDLSRIATQVAAVAAALALAACGAQPYPEPSEAPPPPPPPTALMGEPTPPPPPPPAETQAYQSSGPVIIAMAPIPNPPERPRAARRPRARVRAAEAPPTYRYIAPARPRAAAPARPRAAAPARPAYQSGTVAPRPVAKAAPQPAPKAAAKAAPTATPKLAPKAAPSTVAKVAPATKPAQPKLSAAPVLKTPAAPEGNATSPLGDRATRLAALEMSLAEAVANTGKLTAPASFTANQPADVTLTLPAEFADTVRDEAAKNELSDAAAAVNITSVLSGDGFAVTPDATQSQPLVAGQPTEFHWTVTAMPDAKNLHADVGADLIGAGSDMLNLGTVTTSSGGFKLTPRWLGAGILVLIAVLVIAGLLRGRGGPARSSAARRNARRARQEPRPVNLGSENDL